MRLVVALLLMTATAIADPRADLASPDPKLRDAAAATLVTSWKAPAKTAWDKLKHSIKPGEPQASVVAKLPKGYALGIGHAGGGSTMQIYQLDDLWQLQVYYNDRNRPMTVLSHNVIEGMPHVWVSEVHGHLGDVLPERPAVAPDRLQGRALRRPVHHVRPRG